MRRLTQTSLLAACLWFAGCGGERDAASRPLSPSPAPAPPRATSSPAPTPDAGTRAAVTEPASPPLCPAGMRHVKHEFCPKMQRQCLKSEYDKSNHITICHRFKPGSEECLEKRLALDFCIDEYEFPNQKGGHPPVMVSFYDAAGECAALGKRLCYESEWTAACEGPKEKPFPYGYERSAQKCNIDNRWINPSLKKFYSDDPRVSGPELKRLDQSVPSGSKAECKSDFGVYDMTGNFDEWALADHDRPDENAVFAALKGGAWGHVRNACRPVTTSHEPEFRYYFISFRCCKDASG